MKNIIIALVGLCGSGKSVAAEYFVNEDYHVIHFGGITMDEMKKQNLAVCEENERQVREELRNSYGMGAYATLSIPKIDALLKDEKKVLIDGLYSFTEYKILKEKYKDGLMVIAIYTPKAIRYKRLSERAVRPLTPQKAMERDFAEIDNIEKGGPIAIADHTVINTGSKEQLFKSLEEIMGEQEHV
ncbi:MAG: AAA family ATPase [Spirochaetota bacterium]|nr:AAA family ATPase [Spirochaetota bacterium]